VTTLKSAFDRVVDAIDIETFLLAQSEEEAKQLALALAQEMGLRQADVVFVEQRGPGARVRIRGYVHHPGDRYRWLESAGEDEP